MIKYCFKNYFEVFAFCIGLLLLALMNPETNNGISLCMFDQLGVPWCPGEGLGHSISYLFRGEVSNAMEANILGPFAIIILGGRITHLLWKNHKYQ